MAGRANDMAESRRDSSDRSAVRSRHVTILLALKNGADYLPDQLYSISAQTHRDWSLIVSDDGSTDAGPAIVRCFAARRPAKNVKVVQGPAKGFAANFLSLLDRAPDSSPFVAFCDQDDFWLPSKLARALSALEKVAPGTPAVYCSRTWICDARLRRRQPSGLHRHAPGFPNAIVQSIGGGNTMVLNAPAASLVRRFSAGLETVPSHDWWTYQVIAGAGGQVVFDEEPTVLYRQHGRNVIGADNTLGAKINRLRLIAAGQMAEWNDANIGALLSGRRLLTREAQRTLKDFMSIRQSPPMRRLSKLRKAGVFHQSMIGMTVIWLAAVTRRL